MLKNILFYRFKFLFFFSVLFFLALAGIGSSGENSHLINFSEMTSETIFNALINGFIGLLLMALTVISIQFLVMFFTWKKRQLSEKTIHLIWWLLFFYIVVSDFIITFIPRPHL